MDAAVCLVNYCFCMQLRRRTFGAYHHGDFADLIQGWRVRVPIGTVICLLLPLLSCGVHGGLCVWFFGRDEEDKVPCPPVVAHVKDTTAAKNKTKKQQQQHLLITPAVAKKTKQQPLITPAVAKKTKQQPLITLVVAYLWISRQR